MPARPLIGRQAQLDELTAAFDTAAGGTGTVCVISGEPGIGKTRLAEELTAHARSRGAQVHWGRAWEAEGAPSFWPWVQLVRSLGASEPAFAPLLPELGAASTPSEPGQAPFRLAVAVLERLERAGAVQVLVFDDLHAADLASLQMVQLVAREARALKLMLVCTYREVEARRRPPVAAALARIAREGTNIPLGPLAQSAASALLERCLGHAAAPELRERVLRTCEGNPLFIHALSRLPAGTALPDTVRETLLQRLSLLPAPAREVLEVASVLGRELELSTLQAACKGEVLGALGEGLSAGVLSEAGPLIVRFSHVLAREALYQSLSAARRAELHARCAEALATKATDHPFELAHHFVNAAPVLGWARAAEHSARAGDRALELSAFDDAASHFANALRGLEQTGAPGLARGAVLCRLGEAQARAGQQKAGLESCRAAAALARDANDAVLLARCALAMGAELTPGRANPELAAVLEEARKTLGAAAPALEAQLLAREAAARMPSPEHATLLAMAREAVTKARLLNDPRVLAQVIGWARATYTTGDDLAERLDLDAELAALGRQLDARHLALQAHGRLVLDHVEQGDVRAVEAQLAVYDALSDALPNPLHQWRGVLLKLMWATLRGDAAECDRWEAAARELAGRLEDARLSSSVDALCVQRALLEGNDDALEKALARMESQLAGEPFAGFWPVALRASRLAARGREAEARTLLERGIPVQLIETAGPAVLALLAPVLAVTESRETLERLYGALAPHAGHHAVAAAVPLCFGPCDLALGRFAAALGRAADAAKHFAAARALAEKTGALPYLRRIERPEPRPPPQTTTLELQREGELWTVRFGGEQLRLKHSKGLVYLGELVRRRGEELHAVELERLDEATPEPTDTEGLSVRHSSDAGELLDAQAREAYRRRLEELDEHLREAESFHDPHRAASARSERDAIAHELARAVGLGGRSRRASATSERARINVQRRLRDVIAKIREQSEPLARHLEAYLRTGAFCTYRGG